MDSNTGSAGYNSWLEEISLPSNATTHPSRATHFLTVRPRGITRKNRGARLNANKTFRRGAKVNTAGAFSHPPPSPEIQVPLTPSNGYPSDSFGLIYSERWNYINYRRLLLLYKAVPAAVVVVGSKTINLKYSRLFDPLSLNYYNKFLFKHNAPGPELKTFLLQLDLVMHRLIVGRLISRSILYWRNSITLEHFD